MNGWGSQEIIDATHRAHTVYLSCLHSVQAAHGKSSISSRDLYIQIKIHTKLSSYVERCYLANPLLMW